MSVCKHTEDAPYLLLKHNWLKHYGFKKTTEIQPSAVRQPLAMHMHKIQTLKITWF